MSHLIKVLFVIAVALVFVTDGIAQPRQKPTPAGQYDYVLTLGEETFDPLTEVIVMPTQWEVASGSGHDLRLVQFDGPIQESWVDAMRDAGVIPVQYIHPFTYVTWADPQHRDAVFALPHVRWTGDFLNGYKVLPRWRTLDENSLKARLLLYKGVELEEALGKLQLANATRIEHRSLDDRFTMVSFVSSGSAFLDISQIQGVFTIQPVPTDGGLRSEMSNQVNAGNVDGGNMAYPGYQDWLDSIGLSGNGVIVAIVDGGSDESHVDLAGQFVACDGQSCGGNSSSSHGTHTAGIVGATGASGTTDSYGFLRGQGVAPGVSLLEQKYFPTYQQPGGMTQLMIESYRNGASVSSNSWGPSGSPLGYDIDTLEVDIGIRDADPDEDGNQQFSYVLAIMNGYGGTSTQGTPDEAKNIFTIGSTKMQTSGGSQYTHINDISSNSAHGPCLDGRTIPHMVAPGCSVDSTTPGSYSLMCGTSMACPHVAGAVALFTQQYIETYGIEPTPALIKAAFAAASRDLSGNDDADGGTLGHPFDSKQGWGRMDLPSVLSNEEGSVRYFDAPVVLDQTGDQWTATVAPINPSQPMKIMLVWTDAVGHGLGGSTPAWNNDLDLTVSAGLSTYRGNNFGSAGWSTTGGSADGKNNTEGVFLGPSSPSLARITVTAANLNSDGIPNQGDGIDQDFSLVCYNCVAEPSYNMSVDPMSQSVCAPDEVQFTVTIGQIMGYEVPVSLSAVVSPGITAEFSSDTVIPPAVVTLTLAIEASTQEMTHMIEIHGEASDGLSQEVVVPLGVSTSLPSSVALLYPENGETDVSVIPTFSWVGELGAQSWRLQVSTTNSSSGIVHDVSNITSPTYAIPMVLDSNTPYFWRVQASNHCGNGFWSSWWTFRTTDAMVVLLVDDDDNSPDVRSTYTTMLDNAGILYEIWDTNNSNNEPDAAAMQGYPLVVWFTGDEWGGFSGPGSTGETALATYIDAGGRLLMSSQDYLYDNGLTSFGQNYLGIASFVSDVTQTTVIGSDIFDDMGSVSLSYPFTNYSDVVSPSSAAGLSFSGNQGDAGVYLEGVHGGGSIFLGFPVETMSESDRQVLMADVVAWMGGTSEPCPADCNGDGSVDIADLLAIIEGWGTTSGCDINGDGPINILDLLAVVAAWGECP